MCENKVKILWSGITGRTGQEALRIAKENDSVEMVAGVCRSDNKYYTYDELDKIKEEFDVIVDFSHKDSFDKVLEYAIKVNKPLIIGTAGLTDEQMKAFEKASDVIPIFRGGNFRFDVKKFIDNVVEYAKTCNDKIELIETHYKTKKIPSETAKVISKRVFEETGKEIIIKSYLEYDELINDWKVANLHCRVIGFKELARDVLRIAVMMKDKKPDGVYDLDRLIKEQKLGDEIMFNIDHVAISVKDLDETLKFYKKFGFILFKEYHDEMVEIVMLKLDEIFLEIFHYNDNYELPEHSKELGTDLKTIGTKHFALRVKNIDDAKQWIENRNLNEGEIKINKGRLGRAYFFIKDPNGILIEIIEER